MPGVTSLPPLELSGRAAPVTGAKHGIGAATVGPKRPRGGRLPSLERLASIIALLSLFAVPVAAAPPPLYHSPNDDGVSGGIPATVPPGQAVTLHLYLGVGTTASTQDACDQGDGEELCGHRATLEGTGVNLQSFTPADPDILFNLTANRIDLIGGDFQVGDLGPTKLGDLVIDGPEGGTLDLTLGEFVTTQLAKEKATVPTTIVALPEPAGPVPLAVGFALLLALPRRRPEGVSRRPGH